MSKEKKAIEFLKDLKELDITVSLTVSSSAFCNGRYYLSEEEKTNIDKVINLINKQQKEIERLKEIIIAIRHELKGNVIVKDDNGYAPAKNLTKQEVYESYVKLNLLLKANYIFKEDEDVIKELLEE